MDLNKEPFGTMPDGKSIEKFTLSNSRGITAAVISFGGILTAFTMPDSKGEAGNITPGYDTLSEYLSDRYYLGAIIGRFANRIAGGRFQLDGIQYTLARNEGGRSKFFNTFAIRHCAKGL
ncbi:Aldose 1-epimerase [subsurface metagenome]